MPDERINPLAWTYRPTGTPHLYEVLRDGVVVLSVAILAGHEREALLLEDIQHGLNEPVPLRDRGFQGAGGDMLTRRRSRRP
jgi:hypothetical protein